MPTSAPGSSGRTSAIRIMIIDDHEISRAAIRELLRAEGMDVTADFKATPHALTAARALNPEMVIVDVTPMAGTGFSIARGLSGLPAPPVVILTSSADPAQFGAELNSYRFIAKADITATVITDLANTREEAVPNRDTPAKHHQPRR